MLFILRTFIKVEYQQNSDIINDVIDYVLCCVLSNELYKNNLTVSTVSKISYAALMHRIAR